MPVLASSLFSRSGASSQLKWIIGRTPRVHAARELGGSAGDGGDGGGPRLTGYAVLRAGQKADWRAHKAACRELHRRAAGATALHLKNIKCRETVARALHVAPAAARLELAPLPAFQAHLTPSCTACPPALGCHWALGLAHLLGSKCQFGHRFFRSARKLPPMWGANPLKISIYVSRCGRTPTDLSELTWL